MEGQEHWDNVTVSPKGTVPIKPSASCNGAWGPQAGEVTCLSWVTRLSIYSLIQSPHLSYKRDQVKMRDYMDRRVTSTTWGPPPLCKQAPIQARLPGKPISANRGLNLANRGINFIQRLDSVPESAINLNLGIIYVLNLTT